MKADANNTMIERLRAVMGKDALMMSSTLKGQYKKIPANGKKIFDNNKNLSA